MKKKRERWGKETGMEGNRKIVEEMVEGHLRVSILTREMQTPGEDTSDGRERGRQLRKRQTKGKKKKRDI